jgi:type III secretion protein Q
MTPLTLPVVTHEDVRFANQLYRSRQAWQGHVIGHPTSVQLVWDSRPLEHVLSLPFVLDGQTACLHVPSSLVRALGGSVAPGIEAPALLRALLIEQALLPTIELIEQSTKLAVRFIAGPTDVAQPKRLSFQITLQSRTFPAELDLAPESFALLLPHLEELFPANDLPLAQLRLPVTLCIGQQQVRLSELDSLERGDVVMLRSSQDLWISVENRLRADLAAAAEGYQLRTGLVSTSVNKEWDMSEASIHSTTTEDDPLRDVPVTVVCEAGRLELPLGEVKALGEGSILTFPNSTDETVEITVNGRRIGRGALVRIGEGLGVRITSLSTHG